MHATVHQVTAGDGTPLCAREFRPAAGRPERTLVIVHGLSEHSERYTHVAAECTHRGWRLLAVDLRGHGRSGGVPTHVTSFDQYLDDLDLVWRQFDLSAESTAVLGHSMGGLIGVRYLQTRSERASALVVLSPLLRVAVSVNRMKLATGRMLARFAPRVRFQTRIDASTLTRDLAAIQRRQNDPLMHRSVTAGWYVAMEAALAAAHLHVNRLRLPVLVMQGSDDRIVCPRAAEPWLAGVASADKRLEILPGRYHELLHEIDWQSTVAAITEWLDPRVAPGVATDGMAARLVCS